MRPHAREVAHAPLAWPLAGSPASQGPGHAPSESTCVLPAPRGPGQRSCLGHAKLLVLILYNKHLATFELEPGQCITNDRI